MIQLLIQDQQPQNNIDLICVIDQSGSMKGTKLKLLQQTLEYLLTLLKQTDRLCLLAFETQAQRLTPLLRVTPQNFPKFQTAINSLKPGGGTNIVLGMEGAFKVIKERRCRNSITGIFLLSDGQDSRASEIVTQQCLSAGIPSERISIHTFGFGADHDPNTMLAIAKMKEGNFYFIEQLEMIIEYFIDAFGSVVSTVAENASLKLNLHTNQEITQCNPKLSIEKNQKLIIKKSFGYNWIFDNTTNQYSLNIPYLFNGSTKNYMFELEIPKLENFCSDSLQESKVLELSLNLQTLYYTNICLKSDLTLIFYDQSSELNKELQNQLNMNVFLNFLRVKGAEVIKQANNFASQGQYQIAQQIFSDLIIEIEQKLLSNYTESIKILIEDLKKSKESCGSETIYKQYGHKFMSSRYEIHQNQQSCPIQVEGKKKSVNLYPNQLQEKLSNEFKQKLNILEK